MVRAGTGILAAVDKWCTIQVIGVLLSYHVNMASQAAAFSFSKTKHEKIICFVFCNHYLKRYPHG